MKICKNCEDVVSENAKFCPECGEEVEEIVVEKTTEETETIEETVEETVGPDKKVRKYKLVVKKPETKKPVAVAGGAVAVIALVGAVVYLVNGRKR